MVKHGELKVTERGIERVANVFYGGEMYDCDLVVPKEVIIEAYEKFLAGGYECDKCHGRFICDNPKFCPHCGRKIVSL